MKKIIVVEGSPTIKSVADSLLRQCGYDVICTADGLQAWEIIRTEKPDLVLTGLGIPGMNGLELCRQMAKDTATGGIPLVLLIGANDQVQENEIAAAGVRGRIRKPFSPKDLLEVVTRLAGPSELAYHKQENPGSGPTSTTKYNIENNMPRASADRPVSANVDWVDISNNQAPSNFEKIASFDLSGEGQELMLEEDQYGLSRPPEPEELPRPPEKPIDEESYDWFIGEMKKEIENKPSDVSIAAPAKSRQATAADETRPTAPMKFDDIQPAKGIVRADQASAGSATQKFEDMAADTARAVKDLISAPAEKQIPRPSATASTEKFTDRDIAQIAEKVAARLATQIAAMIDRKQLIDIIKSVINKQV